MNRIQRVSLYFRILFQIIFFCLPLLQLLAWVKAPQSLAFFSHIIRLNAIPENYPVMHTLLFQERVEGFLVSLIPIGIELFILHCLIKLFRLYEQGKIFSLKHVGYIQKMGVALFVGQLLNPIYELLIGLVVTLGNPHGHRFAVITFDQSNLGILIVGMLFILTSWIMAEGYQLSKEHELII